MEDLFDEIKRYVGFGPADEVLLRELGPFLRPHFARSVDDFYEHIRRHPEASRAISGGDAQEIAHFRVSNDIESVRVFGERFLAMVYHGPEGVRSACGIEW